MNVDSERSSSNAPRVVGGLLILAGLLGHPDALGHVVARDGFIASPTTRVAIIVAQVVLVMLGSVWLFKPRRRPTSALWWGSATGLVLLGVWGNLLDQRLVESHAERSRAVREMVASENRLLDLRQDLRALARSISDLSVPDDISRHMFAGEVSLVDAELPTGGGSSPGMGVTIRRAQPDVPPRHVPRDELSLWSEPLASVAWFEHADFSIVAGRFVDGAGHRASDHRVWTGEVRFHGLARPTAGGWTSWDLAQDVTWVSDGPDPDEARWRISAWITRSVVTASAVTRPFEEVLDRALPDAADRARLRNSRHQEFVLASYLDPDFEPPHPAFSRPAFDRHPGVSVVDLEGDGDDDIYLVDRWGANQLLVNQGDGTYREQAAQWGLDVDGHCSSAAFADFDNDGDPDLFLGRTLEPSRYYVQEDGRFVDRSESLVEGGLPGLVSSVTVADVNGDGLLDVYLATYAYDALRREWDARGMFSEEACLGEFLEPEDAAELYRRMRDDGTHKYRNHPGPPNQLLMNVGAGRLVPRDGPQRLFANTYQASFADIDGDGDADLYCANDFSGNTMLRNEGGHFTDVTEATGSEDIGFGMGVSWGDYDEDQDVDLYVANMYSKAGRRITSQIPGIDPRLADMSRGNSLLRNDGGRFSRVSGVSAEDQLVEAAGWSWGGQFVDLDHDGDLDIHALSGYETVPAAVEGLVDR